MTNEIEARIAAVENGLPGRVKPVFARRFSLQMGAVEVSHYAPGVSVAVINGGEIEWAKAYGVRAVGQANAVNTETLFQAASISKPIAALALLRLVEAGKFDLDTDVNQYLTSWQLPPTDGWQPQLTLRQLLSHSAGTTVSGFLGYSHTDAIPTPLQILEGLPPANSVAVRVDTVPGAQYRYSGGGIGIAQQVASDVMGKPFAEIVYEWALQPLGMTHSTYTQPLPEALYANVAPGHYYTGEPIEGGWYTMPELAAAGMWTIPSDIARFLIALRKAYMGEASPISHQVARWMLTETIPADDGLSVGLGIFLKRWDDTATCEHSGGNVGYKCNSKIYFEGGDYGAVVMTNADFGYLLVEDLFSSIAEVYGWKLPPSDAKPAADVPASDCVGTYQLKTGAKFSINQSGDSLVLQPENQSALELRPLSAGSYTVHPLNASVSFARDGESGAVGILFEQNGKIISGARLPTASG